MAFRRKTKKAPEKASRKGPEAFGVEPLEEMGGAMGLAEGMRNLTQEILNAFDPRIESIAALKHETAAMLKGFREEFRRKAADLKRFLSNAEGSRMRDFRAMHQGIMARQEERSGETAALMNRLHRGSEERTHEVRNMLGDFRREFEAAAGHWRTMAAAMAKKRASAA